MRPYIQDGDLITVSPLRNSSGRVGDVVLYKTADHKVIVHRVVQKTIKDKRTVFFIKGDASFGPPEEIDIQNVLGKVIAIERNGKKRKLDSKLNRIIGLFFARLSPFSRWIYPLGSTMKYRGRKLLGSFLEKLQSIKFYSFLVKKLVKENIRYKIATPDDTSLLSRLYRYNQQPESENPTDTLKEQIKNPEDSGYWIVAKQKDKVIGGVSLTKFQESEYPQSGWWLFGMKVNWRYRRMGIGEKMLEMVTEVAAKNNASEIKLLVFKDAKPAITLYQKLGFRQISIPELDRNLQEEAKINLRRRIILAKDIKSG